MLDDTAHARLIRCHATRHQLCARGHAAARGRQVFELPACLLAVGEGFGEGVVTGDRGPRWTGLAGTGLLWRIRGGCLALLGWTFAGAAGQAGQDQCEATSALHANGSMPCWRSGPKASIRGVSQDRYGVVPGARHTIGEVRRQPRVTQSARSSGCGAMPCGSRASPPRARRHS